MRSLFYTLFISALVAVVSVSAFPDHSGTCISDATTIEGVPGSPMGKLVTTLGYNFQVKMSKNNYVPKGSPVKFTVTGKNTFMGLLLYAVDSKKNHVGSWNTPTGFKILTNPQCNGDPSGTLSHSDSTLKGPTVNFMWTPPDNDVGPISFVGTVVESGATGFQVIKVPTNFTVAGSKLTGPPASASASNAASSPTSYNYPSDSPNASSSNSTETSGTSASATDSTHSAASSLTRSALLLPLTVAISLLFHYLNSFI